MSVLRGFCRSSPAGLSAALLLTVGLFFSPSSARGGEQNQAPRFESDILPVFEANCLVCHGENLRQNGLDLRTRDATLKGGETGAGIAPGRPDESLLFQKVSSGAMPMGPGKLGADEIELIRKWIEAGALKQGEDLEAAKSQLAAQQVTEREALVTILHVKCIVCHGKRIQRAGLDLRTRAGLLKGGKSGPAIVPGKPDESLLIKRITAREMPPPEWQFSYFTRDISSGELEKLRQWIAAGAPPDSGEVAQVGDGPDPLISDEERKFWSFVAPSRPAAPSVEDQDSVRTPIDAFLLRKLQQKELSFSLRADDLTLMRRAYLDLTGLPPDPEEVVAYQNDSRPDAYERLIDRLLESSHYGERWGKYWLDAAGYSDSEGGAADDRVRPHSYRYRDYVIRSLNADKPYDQFLTEQIAGDELFDYKAVKKFTPQQLDYLVATGFLRMTPDPTNSHDVNFVPFRFDTIAAQVQMLGSTVMGLTTGCARCHSHKFDPIPHRDYYSLGAILRTAYDPYDWLMPNKLTGASFEREPYAPKRLLLIPSDEGREEREAHNAPIKKEIERLKQTLEEKAAPLREELLGEKLAQLPEDVREDALKAVQTPEEERSSLQKYLVKKLSLEILEKALEERFLKFKDEARDIRIAILKAEDEIKPDPMVRALYDMGGEPTPAYILRRGDSLNPGPRVFPGVPSVLRDGIEPYKVVKPPWTTDTSGQRLAFARWLTQPNHPLTARVMVNRIWQYHFGTGLVGTPGNFGKLGVPPSHPELLDWLATEFVRQKWSMKAMHRLIMTSAAYRQRSKVDPAAREADPGNSLLSRFPFKRMDAEALRDSVLKVAQRLDATPFGPPDEIEQTEEGEVVAKPTEKGFRRSIYMLQKRETPSTLLTNFDAPRLDDGSPNCLRREYSTVSTQALQLLNSDLLRESARYFAGRVMDAAGDDVARQVDRVYLAALSRPPSAEEKVMGVRALGDLTRHWREHLDQETPAEPKEAKARWLALGAYCHTILNSPDFVYID